MIRNSKPSPILFSLINSGDDGAFTDLIFSTLLIMINVPESSIERYISNLSAYFTHHDIKLLKDRIADKRNKEIPMNEKHIIILFALINANLIVFKKERAIANRVLTDYGREEIRDEINNFLERAENNIAGFKLRFKSNHGMTSAFAKILEL